MLPFIAAGAFGTFVDPDPDLGSRILARFHCQENKIAKFEVINPQQLQEFQVSHTSRQKLAFILSSNDND